MIILICNEYQSIVPGRAGGAVNSSAVPPGAPAGRTAVILRQISQTQPLTLVCSVPTALAAAANLQPVMDTKVKLQHDDHEPIMEKAACSAGGAAQRCMKTQRLHCEKDKRNFTPTEPLTSGLAQR